MDATPLASLAPGPRRFRFDSFTSWLTDELWLVHDTTISEDGREERPDGIARLVEADQIRFTYDDMPGEPRSSSTPTASPSRAYRVRHVGEPTGQLHEARRVLGLTVDYYRQFARLGDQLALAPISERHLHDILGQLYPDDAALGGRALRARARARETIFELFVRGDTVGNAPGSKWCAWNAIVEHHDHHGRPRTTEGAFVRKLEDPTGIKRRALELITAA